MQKDGNVRSVRRLENSHSSNDLTLNIRRVLEEQLSGGSGPSSFAFWSQHLPDIHPGLNVHGLGPIALPISEGEAKRIISSAKKSAYGKGSETLVDETVRKTWEIDARDLTIENSKWEKWLHTLLEQVKEGLGLKTERVRADLYKLLVYGPGAHFKPHRDTEKTPGMFGTLIICLPARHEGGDLCVLHGENERIFSTAANSAFGMSCAAWYSDVLHEVKPVVSGHRVVLTYNLAIQDTKWRLSAETSGNDEILSRVLRDHAANVGSNSDLPSEWIHRLNHKYTQSSLSIERLKGGDQTTVKRLVAAASATHEIYLALLVREVSGGAEEDYREYSMWRSYSSWDEDDEDDDDQETGDDDGSDVGSAAPTSRRTKHSSAAEHPIYEADVDSIHLKHIKSLDGKLLSTDILANKESLIQDIYGKERAPDREDYEGYTGNEGASATHWYYDSVILLVPKNYAYAFRLGPALQNEELIPCSVDSLIKSIEREESQATENLKKLCQFCLTKEQKSKAQPYSFSNGRLSDNSKKALVRACAAVQDTTIFCGVMALFDFSTDVEFFDVVGQHFNVSAPDLEMCLERVLDAIADLRKPHARLKALELFDCGYRASHPVEPPWLTDFIKDSVDIVVDPLGYDFSITSPFGPLSHEDGSALAAIIWKYNRTDLEGDVLALGRHIASTAAAFGFLTGMLDAYHDDEDLNLTKLKSTFLPLYIDSVQHLDLRAAAIQSRRTDRAYSYYGSKTLHNNDADSISTLAQQVARLYGQCLPLECIPGDHLLDAVATSMASEWPKDCFENFTMPLLKGLLEVLQQSSSPYDSHDGRHQQFFRRVVDGYLKVYIGRRPMPPSDWSRKKVACCCKDCTELNIFLVNPIQQVACYTWGQKRHKHLSLELSRTREMHDESTTQPAPKKPYTLVITKTTKLYQQEFDKWRANVKHAQSILSGVGPDALRSLLGENYFDGGKLNLAKTPLLQPASASAVRSPLVDTNNNAKAKRGRDESQLDLPNAKRKHIEVFDLT